MSTSSELIGRVRLHLAKRAEFYWAPLLYALAVAYLYSAVLSGHKGFGWDTIESYWPDMVFFDDHLLKGEWPLWNPYDRGGYPFSADPQPGMYYPIHWLLAAVSALLGGSSWALIQFKMLLHHVIAGLCLHAFLRHRGLPRTAAVVGGMALIASSPWLIHKASSLLMPIAWAPLIWIATDRIIRRPTWQRAAALAAAIALAGSAGSPPGFFYVLLMATAYGVFRVLESSFMHYRGSSLWPHSGHLLLALAAAGLLVFGLLWVSTAPALELATHSPRAGRSLGYALSVPLAMWPTLKALVVPTAGQLDAYCGILVLMLGGCALLLGPRRDRCAPIFFFAAAVLFLSMSFGAQLPVLRYCVEHFPGFSLFRISSRYKCLFAPMLACLAGYGAASLLQLGPAVRPRRLIVSWETGKVLALALATIVGTLYLLDVNPLPSSLARRFPGPAVPIVLTLLAASMLVATAIQSGRGAILIVAIMPLLILGDPERYWHHQQKFLEAKISHEGDMALIHSLSGVLSHEYRIYDEFVLEQRAGSRLQVRDFRGYPSGDPLDLKRYQDVLARANRSPELLEAYNVRYLLRGPHHRSGTRSYSLKRDPATSRPEHFLVTPRGLREAKHPVAIVQWYGTVAIEPANGVLDAVLEAEEQDGLRTRVILERDAYKGIDRKLLDRLVERNRSPTASVPGKLLSFETDEVLVSIVAPAEGIVVLNEVNYPGWQVSVDGTRVPSVTANYLLRAVAVSPGYHRIKWRYRPLHRGRRRLLFWASVFLLFTALAWRKGAGADRLDSKAGESNLR